MSVEERKALLRARMKRERAGVSAGHKARAAEAVKDRVVSLPAFSSARTVLLFDSFGSEIDTGPIAAASREAGKGVLLPYLDGGRMEVAEAPPGDPLAATGYGPREPSRRSPVDPGRVDLVIVPGLAFDRRGHRLGYGAGHYDGYLRRLRPDVPRVAVAYASQLLDEVPAETGDERVDLVVTEDEVVECR